MVLELEVLDEGESRCRLRIPPLQSPMRHLTRNTDPLESKDGNALALS